MAWLMRDSPLINMSWRVPVDMEDEMDNFFEDMERFMRRTHTMYMPRLEGARALRDDTQFPRLKEFYVSKGPDQDEITGDDTGNLLYTRSDAYADPLGISKHLALMNNTFPEWSRELERYNRDFGLNISPAGNLKVIRSLEDRVGEVKIERGHSVVNMTWKVPKDMEKEMDEFWANHEQWMRSSHRVGGIDAEPDTKAPRVTNYWVAKGPELKDPQDPSSGDTGFIIYSESETYPDVDGVDKHMKLAKDTWGDGWEQLKAYNTEYGILSNVNACRETFVNWRV